MADNGGSHSAQVAPAARQEAGAPARARKARERRGRQLKVPRARTSRGGALRCGPSGAARSAKSEPPCSQGGRAGLAGRWGQGALRGGRRGEGAVRAAARAER
eukprot:15435415-Alexandrium_andersonii.AAC.1